MLAVGTRPAAIVRMVAYETTALMALGSIMGYAAGALIVGYLARTGVDQSRFFREYSSIPGVTGIIYPKLFWASILAPGVLLFIGSVLASLYPAGQAARVNAVKALRHT